MTDIENDCAYKDSSEAYRAIHSALSWAVSVNLEECEYTEACKFAAMMRDIEDHTDLTQPPN